MLSDADAAILTMIRAAITSGQEVRPGSLDRAREDSLRAHGLLGLEHSSTSTRQDRLEYCIVLTPAGIDALIAHEKNLEEAEKRRKEVAEQHAKEDANEHKAERLRVKDARRSWWQFFLGLLIGWVLGAITPFDVWAWVIDFVGGLIHP